MRETINNQIVELMFTIGKTMHSNPLFSDATHNLTLQQISTIIFLAKNQDATMSEVASYFTVTLPSANALIAKLEDQSLVKKTTDKQDKRITHIKLTKKGEIVIQEAVKVRSLKAEKFLSYLNMDEKETLLKILISIHKRLSAHE